MNKLLSSTLLVLTFTACQPPTETLKPLAKIVKEKSAILAESEGYTFRDLNSNGSLDVYEDINQPMEARIEDLLKQMTLQEKAGMMFINGAPVNDDASLEKKTGEGMTARMPPAIQNIDSLKMTHFNIWGIPEDPAVLARWYNNLQAYAEKTRLGIPITIASDPRHHFSESIFSMTAVGFSQFCETLGFAAIGSDSVLAAFADIVRQEYLAVGIREALHPQIDLATEPRWARISGSFGSDADLTAKLAKAYILGLQTENLSADGVACMTKHFPGGGPQNEGLDPHFEFHKGQIYPGNNFDYHLIPFEAAFEANTAAIMPYYGVPVDQTNEEVAMAYNKAIITDLLRIKYEYDGVVCTDWGLITDSQMGSDVVWPARAWGVEQLSEEDRVLRVIDAGCDQFGGENVPEYVVSLVENKMLSEERIDESVRRLLRQKFQLGLFDNPFVNDTRVSQVVGAPAHREFAEHTQQMAMTLLKNDASTLPLPIKTLKVYIENMDSSIVSSYATVVSDPSEADVAIIRLKTPWYPVDTKNRFALGFHHGDLDFKGAEKQRILDLLNMVPTVVDIYLDRPAVIPEIAAASEALIANYGASDFSVCEVLFGNNFPMGNLPFELPVSMEAVEGQLTDVADDSQNPLYPFGHGLRY